MTDTIRQDSAAGPSARAEGRVAGAYYLLNTLTILAAIALMRGVVVRGDPSATAASLMANQLRYQAGWALEVLSTACSLGVAAYLYRLFVPVSRGLALLSTCFRVIACAVAMVGYLAQAAPLQILSVGRDLGALSSEQLHAIAYLPFRVSGLASNLVIVTFGLHFVALGVLIYRSTFLPRALGVLVVVAGVSALTYLAPSLTNARVVLPLGFVAEASITVWLLTFGINERRWWEREGRQPLGPVPIRS